MKNYLQFSLRALFLSFAVLLSLPMLAVEVEIDGINYDLVAKSKQATVVSKSDKYSGEVVIPEVVEYEGTAYSVTSIGEYTFSYCDGLTSVTIPNSVTSIGEEAFYGCRSLTSVTIPNSVTSIGYGAFVGCYFLRENFINNSQLSNSSYWGAKFVDYETKDGLLIDGTSVICCRQNADIVTIPNSVTTIWEGAFKGCSGLTSVTIPNSVTSIGKSAFYGCRSMTSVSIPNSVTTIGEWAFVGCYFLRENFINNSQLSNSSYWGAKFVDYETKDGLLIDGTSVICCRQNADIVTIPNSVTTIWEGAFYGCRSLTSVTIPNSVMSIGGSAFEGCSGLTSVTIPNSVMSIGYAVFAYCSGLTSVTIPNSVTSIGESAFSGCDSLTSVTIPNSGESIGGGAFRDCDALTSVTIGNGVKSIGDYAFYGCRSLTSVTIPNSVTSIEGAAFMDCSGLTSVTIGNSVRSIGDAAFKGCMLQTIVCKAIQPIEIGNELYSTNIYNHTQLYVPEGAYWDYAFSGWGNFIRIKEMAMDTEDLESRNAYMIADTSGRNYSVYDSTKGNLVNVAYTHALDEESEGSCWTVLKDGATSYLYNIGAKKYGIIADDGMLTLSDSPVGVDIVSTEEGLSINGKPCMFVLNNNIKFDATGIENLDATTENAATYDLSGRRVQNAQKGIYIKNGKKVMVK